MVACLPTNDRNYPCFIDRDKNEGVDGTENGDGACRDFEVGAKVAVHKGGLADEEG